MGLRYGLLAALTLVLASALLWDRLHPPRTTALHRRDAPAAEETVRIVVGGAPDPAAPAPGAGPAAAAPAPAAPPATPAAAPRGEREYVVAAGDTLGGISLAVLGTSRRAREIAALNDMPLDGILRPGRTLRIPPDGQEPPPAAANAPASPAPPAAPGQAPSAPAARIHRVARGETLYGISRRYYGDGGRWRAIAEANGLDEGDPLTVGRGLRIP